MFISLCTPDNFFLWLVFSIISARTGAPYRRSGCIPPVYITFKALWLRPQFSFADFDRANIIFLHFSVACVICSLNVSLLSIIIPRYFMVLTCRRSLLFKYTSRSFLSFLFRRVVSITFDFWTLNRTLLSFAHFEIFCSSILAVFSTSLTDFPLVSIVARDSGPWQRDSLQGSILSPSASLRLRKTETENP